jgi:hypothetical protein
LHRPERLAGDGHSERDTGDRVEQADEPDRACGQQLQPAEPHDVGQHGRDQADVEEPEHRRSADVRRAALDQQRDWSQDQPAGQQLPRRERQHRDRRLPALAQDEPDRGEDHRRQRGGETGRVQRLAGSEHQQRDPEETDRCAGQAEDPRPLAD